ncbi:MAG TPA: NAD kinase [Bacteroidales bacterium]|nr:NAD kinase [Bacteroidales bacterium]
MVAAIYGKEFKADFLPAFELFLEKLHQYNVQLLIHKSFLVYLGSYPQLKLKNAGFFTGYADLPRGTNYFFSIGGDGTFLESASLVRDKDIPIVGINSGRLGFLADIAQEEIAYAIDAIFDKQYTFEPRTLLKLETAANLFDDYNCALNEFTIVKRDSGSMITIHTHINGKFLNTYWADGLIVATPTGSTAYSLSTGGPIVLPTARNFIITPIAPHNLTVRPMVIPDDSELVLSVEGRFSSYLTTLDFQYKIIEKTMDLKIKRAQYTIKVLKLNNHSFFTTLRNKLKWGLDSRN